MPTKSSWYKVARFLLIENIVLHNKYCKTTFTRNLTDKKYGYMCHNVTTIKGDPVSVGMSTHGIMYE